MSAGKVVGAVAGLSLVAGGAYAGYELFEAKNSVTIEQYYEYQGQVDALERDFLAIAPEDTCESNVLHTIFSESITDGQGRSAQTFSAALGSACERYVDYTPMGEEAETRFKAVISGRHAAVNMQEDTVFTWDEKLSGIGTGSTVALVALAITAYGLAAHEQRKAKKADQHKADPQQAEVNSVVQEVEDLSRSVRDDLNKLS